MKKIDEAQVKVLSDQDVMKNITPFSGSEMSSSEAALMAGKTMVRTQTQYTTAVAVQQPRSITKIHNNVLEEAALAGEEFYYGWNVKTKKGKRWIDGPSIDLGMCVARNYGNCAIDVEVEETASHYLFKGVFIDLESGVTFPRLYRQRKSQGMGKAMDDDIDRKEDIVFQIGQSKAIRNAIVSAMPNWLIKKAVAKAQEAVKKGIGENLPEARANALKFFTMKGATQEQIEATMGKPADDWSADDIVELRGMKSALLESRVSIQELFASAEAEPKEPKPKDDDKKTDEEQVDDDEMEKFAAESKKLADGFIEDIAAKDTLRKLNGIVKKIIAVKQQILPEHFELIKIAGETQKQKLLAPKTEDDTTTGGEKEATETTEAEATASAEEEVPPVTEKPDGLTGPQITLVQNQLGAVNITQEELFQAMGISDWSEIGDIMDAIKAIGEIRQAKEGTSGVQF